MLILVHMYVLCRPEAVRTPEGERESVPVLNSKPRNKLAHCFTVFKSHLH